jgi:hypothetical protein
MSSSSTNQPAAFVPGDAIAGGAAPSAAPACHHCGLDCHDAVLRHAGKDFCCRGCLTVFELLVENGLTNFYQLGHSAGMQFQKPDTREQFGYLDDPALRSRLVQFDSDKLTRITLRVPAIHCVACIWLLENLPRLNPAINETRVNFPRKEVALSFDPRRLKLSEAVALLTSLGYQPELRFDDLDRVTTSPVSRRLWLQLGIAGLCPDLWLVQLRAGVAGVPGERGGLLALRLDRVAPASAHHRSAHCARVDRDHGAQPLRDRYRRR